MKWLAVNWSVLSNIITLIAGWLLGYWHGRTAQRSLTLSLTKAAPKIGTNPVIEKRQEQSAAFPPFYYLVVTIYNEGELAAKQLNGQCKLVCPSNEVKEFTVPISREFLGPSPYKLDDRKLQGTTLDAALRGEQTINFGVDIQFDYLLPPKNKKLHYACTYDYDNQTRQLRRKV